MNPTVTLEDIYSPVEPSLQRVPTAILDVLKTSNELAGDVIQYFFSGKGKLLRPALALLGAEMFRPSDWPEAKNRQLIELASAYEIFHAATLIHDDIIDASYVRRNLPTVNVKWGAQTAVLVGDFLHDKAMGVIFGTGDRRIFANFLETAGIVCDGEIHELNQKANYELGEDEYLEIIDKKTAALLACAIEGGALFAGASVEEAAALKRFGRAFGLAFQIVDDCLDFTGNEFEFGKTLGADFMGGVLTLPLIRLLAMSGQDRREEILGLFHADAGPEHLKRMLELIRDYGTVEYAMEKAREYNLTARAELTLLPDCPVRRSLDKLLDYVLERQR